jgi:hypothetical protein
LVALVLITTQNADGQDVARGSGFFVDKSLVATNFHVLKWASDARAKVLADGVEYPIKVSVDSRPVEKLSVRRT